MRVLHLIPSLEGGGAERQLSYLAGGLRDLGCEVHVGLLREGTNLPRIEQAGAIVHRISAHGNYDPLLLPRIALLMRRVKPDVVQTWLTQMDVVGGVVARLTGTPWVLSERASAGAYPHDLRHSLRRFLGRFAKAVIANSEGGLEFWPPSRARHFVVPNGLAMEEMERVQPEPLDVGDAKVILFAGRLVEHKNMANLFDALTMVVRERNAVALLCGIGPMEAELRTRIAALGLSDRVRLLGYCDHVWSLMKRADAFVSVSWAEGSPNVVLEAAACGCPLVLSDIPAHRELFDAEAAELVPPGDAPAIAAAIERVLDDRDGACRRAARAREMVRKFSIEAAAQRYLQVYRQVMN